MIYSLGVRTNVVTNGAACLEVFTGANSAAVLEIMITNGLAVGQTVGLGRPAAQGVTPAGQLLALENTAVVGTTQIATSWGTGPTTPARFHRRGGLPGTIGAGIVWTFLRGLLMPANASLVLWNLTTGSPLDVVVILDE